MTLSNVLLDFTAIEIKFGTSDIDEEFIDELARKNKRINFYLAVSYYPEYLENYYNIKYNKKALLQFAEKYLVPEDQIIYTASEGLKKTLLNYPEISLMITGLYNKRADFYRNIYGEKIPVYKPNPVYNIEAILKTVSNSLIIKNNESNLEFLF